jgi:hypothetical protein
MDIQHVALVLVIACVAIFFLRRSARRNKLLRTYRNHMVALFFLGVIGIGYLDGAVTFLSALFLILCLVGWLFLVEYTSPTGARK